MTDTKFTPGPWEVKEEGEKWLWVGPASWVKRICRVVLYNGTEREDKANAHLIAAAPDLYDALERAEYMLRQYGMRPEFYREVASEARSALAKARGEQ